MGNSSDCGISINQYLYEEKNVFLRFIRQILLILSCICFYKSTKQFFKMLYVDRLVHFSDQLINNDAILFVVCHYL